MVIMLGTNQTVLLHILFVWLQQMALFIYSLQGGVCTAYEVSVRIHVAMCERFQDSMCIQRIEIYIYIGFV